LGINLPGPYLTVYLVNSGISLPLIALSLSVNKVISFTVNYPGGVIADRAGRIKSYAVGAITFSISMLLLFMKPTPHIVLLYAILSGVGFAFMSGTREAWLIDRYYSNKRKHSPPFDIIPIWRSLHAVASATSGLIASIVTMTVGVRYVFPLAGLLVLSSVIMFLTLPDNRGAIRTIQILRTTLRTLKERAFLGLLMYSTLTSSAMIISFIIPPLILTTRGLDEGLLGLIYTLFYISMALGSALASRVARRIHPLHYLLAYNLLVFVIYIAVASLGSLEPTILLFILVELLLGIYNVVFIHVRNAVKPSGARASMISLMELSGSLAITIMAPLITSWGITFTLIASGLVTLLAIPSLILTQSKFYCLLAIQRIRKS